MKNKINRKNNVSKISGLTLMESLVSLMILISLSIGIFYMYTEKIKKTQAEVFGSEVIKYLKLTDEKVAISGYTEKAWPIKSSNNLAEFKNFMYQNYNSKYGECAGGGWTPITDKSNTETDSLKERNEAEKAIITKNNKSSLIDCSYFSSDKYYFEMTPYTVVNYNNTTKAIEDVNFLFKFKNSANAKNDFINIKRAVDTMKAQDPKNNSGQHSYGFVSIDDITKDLKPLACLNLGDRCVIKASFKRSGQNDYVRTDGLSPMENSVVTFKMHNYVLGKDNRTDIAHGVVKACDSWSFNEISKSWTKTKTLRCGMGIYENQLVASLIDGEITSKGFYLNQQCNRFSLENSNSPTGSMASVPQDFIDTYGQVLKKDTKVFPCGQFQEGGDYIVLSTDASADEVNIGGPLDSSKDGDPTISDSAADSKLEVAPSEEMINEDYLAKQAYDANPTKLTDEEKLKNPSKGDFQKPSRSSVTRVRDPSLSSTDNTIRKLTTKNLTIYEDLVSNKDSALIPEDVFKTGELEVLNKFSLEEEMAIDSNPFLTAEQKIEAKRKLEYSSIGGDATVAKNLTATDTVIGDDKLFKLSDDGKAYEFRENPENVAKMDYKTNGSIIQIAERINQLTANGEVKVNNLAETRNNLNADTFQFKANVNLMSGAPCEKHGIISANSVYELFICQNGKWENFINDGGISAFNSDTCPVGWRAFTEADGRSLAGTGYLDTIHAGIVQYKTGDKGGEAMHTLTIDEMPSHSHTRPVVDQICTACHYNLGLAKIASGSSIWNQNAKTGATGGGQAHNNMMPYTAVKFCIKGSDKLFDYVEANAPNPTDVWLEYGKEEGDFEDFGPKYACSYMEQVDTISDPGNPKSYNVQVCSQDQRKTDKSREINTRTSQVRYTGIETYEFRTVVTQEAWVGYAPLYTECEEVGANYSCGAWDKDEDDVDFGKLFTKSRECLKDRIRYKQTRERNWINGKIRIVKSEKEECNPPATVTEYLSSTGKNVDRLTLAITLDDISTSSGGHPLLLSGAYRIGSDVGDDSGTVGIPAKTSDGMNVMVKGRKQKRSGSGETFDCEIKLYATKSSALSSSGSGSAARTFLAGYTKLRFLNDSNNQVGTTVPLGSINVYGNYSYKISTGDVCSAVDSMYNGTSAIKNIVIDDQ
jgi:hypothetical protein